MSDVFSSSEIDQMNLEQEMICVQKLSEMYRITQKEAHKVERIIYIDENSKKCFVSQALFNKQC